MGHFEHSIKSDQLQTVMNQLFKHMYFHLVILICLCYCWPTWVRLAIVNAHGKKLIQFYFRDQLSSYFVLTRDGAVMLMVRTLGCAIFNFRDFIIFCLVYSSYAVYYRILKIQSYHINYKQLQTNFLSTFIFLLSKFNLIVTLLACLVRFSIVKATVWT